MKLLINESQSVNIKIKFTFNIKYTKVQMELKYLIVNKALIYILKFLTFIF